MLSSLHSCFNGFLKSDVEWMSPPNKLLSKHYPKFK